MNSPSWNPTTIKPIRRSGPITSSGKVLVEVIRHGGRLVSRFAGVLHSCFDDDYEGPGDPYSWKVVGWRPIPPDQWEAVLKEYYEDCAAFRNQRNR